MGTYQAQVDGQGLSSYERMKLVVVGNKECSIMSHGARAPFCEPRQGRRTLLKCDDAPLPTYCMSSEQLVERVLISQRSRMGAAASVPNRTDLPGRTI
jgi:hypothetical protein